MPRGNWLDNVYGAGRSAIGVGRAALDRLSQPISPHQAAVTRLVNRETTASVQPKNPLTGKSAFDTMGKAKGSAFKGFFTKAGKAAISTADALNLVNSGLSVAQGDYEASPGRIAADVGSVARLARLNKTVAGAGGAPLKLASDPRSALIAAGADMVAPHVKEALNPEANARRYQQNVDAAVNQPPPTYWEKLLGLDSRPSDAWRQSVANGQQRVSPSSFQSIPGTDALSRQNPPRRIMSGAKQLGGASGSRPATYGQLGEIFDFALQRGIDPAYEYMQHVIRRDGLNEQQAKQLHDEFMTKIYNQKSFDNAVNQPLITDPGQLSRYREVI